MFWALPWAKLSKDRIDIDESREILDEDHYGLDKIKRRILEHLAVHKLNPEGKAPILCFVGPPGVGKTSLGRSIARALGRSFHRISLGGIRDEADIEVPFPSIELTIAFKTASCKGQVMALKEALTRRCPVSRAMRASGSVIIETIFAWPGMGQLAIQALFAADYPLLQGLVIMFTFGYVLVALTVDVLYAYIDPRIRYT